MTAFRKLLLSGLLLIIAWTAYGAAQRAVGAAREQAARYQRERDSAVVVADSLRRHRLVQHDTLVRTIVRRDTVLVQHDRWLRDTVPVPVEVVREIVRADSQVIAACLLTLSTCEQETTALRAALLRSDSLVLVWRRQASPGWLRQLTDRIPALAAGVVIGVVLR